jgi:hypothetical protein
MRNDLNDKVEAEAPEKNSNDYSNHQNIYSNLIKNVDEVLNDISKIEIQHQEAKTKNEEVQTKLKVIRNGFVEGVEKLEKNAVWDRFTIAFFGETNAGKSTIIESLRISMREDGKLKNTALKKSLDLKVSELKIKAEDLITSIKKSNHTHMNDLTSELENIKKRAKILDATFWANWLSVFLSWFGLLPIVFFAKKIKLLEDEIFEVDSIVPEQDNNVVKLFEQVSQLKKDKEFFYDGKIIGTGVQDFTQSCIEYQFNQEEKPFTLIDVPGIEGNESKYETMIMDAVSKAHCVFYVCSAGKLPESGTITKIKKYLKEQTEVYFLLNERKNTYTYDEVYTFEAMHPNAEEFKINISNQMKNELGEFYKGCISLQGLMAFCSKAEIQEDERNFKFQKKLLDKFENYGALYSISQLEKIESLIRSQLEGMERKIINANIQKGICAAIDFKNHIKETRNTEYSNDFVQYIETEIKVTKEKNDNNFRELENELSQISYRLTNSTTEDLRKKIHSLIDKKENNPELNVSDAKSLLSPFYHDREKKMKFIAECYTRYAFDDLRIEYQIATQTSVTSFTKDVKINLTKMQSNIKQISSAGLTSNFDTKAFQGFETLFSFDFGKLGASALSIGGLAFAGAPFGPWGIAIGAALGVVFNIVRWFLDEESPESKAKKQIDEKLSSMKTEIKFKLNDSNRKIINDCKENVINKVRIMLDENIEGIKAIQTILDTKTNQLEILIKEVNNSKK